MEPLLYTACPSQDADDAALLGIYRDDMDVQYVQLFRYAPAER